MKKYIFTFVVVFSMLVHSQSTTTDVQIGTVFKIGKPTITTYKHIHLPKANMIIKKGGIADYKRLVGSSVVVTSVNEKKNGVTMIKMKLKNGKRFFGSHKVISAHLSKALESGELQPISN